MKYDQLDFLINIIFYTSAPLTAFTRIFSLQKKIESIIIPTASRNYFDYPVIGTLSTETRDSLMELWAIADAGLCDKERHHQFIVVVDLHIVHGLSSFFHEVLDLEEFQM